ncbi:MAG: aminopeptidase P N-terminal domain-containing protein [Candidatus Binatia bacterium]
MTRNGPNAEVFAQRRQAVIAELEDAVLFIPAVEEAVYSNDVHYRYRPDSNIRYLCGFEEPAALMVSSCEGGHSGFSLFVRETDEKSETWTGKRQGIQGACDSYGADRAFPLGEVAKELERALAGAHTLYFAFSRDAVSNQCVLDVVRRVNAQRPRNGLAAIVIREAAQILHEMRVFKSKHEVEIMRRACRITVEGHHRVMETLRPGMFEYQIEATVDHAFRDAGCAGPAYGTIAASGENATVLHYTDNCGVLRDGELLLLDAGGEYGGYCADVTSTIPVAASFGEGQAQLYDLVLAAQDAARSAVKPGSRFDDVHAAALAVLVGGLVDLEILSGELDDLLENKAYSPYYMHRTSHWLGMDVHDVGSYCDGRASRTLEPGMVLTVEPGLYVRSDAEVPARFKGIGVRIEDDLLVSTSGHENLSAGLPRQRREIEKIRRKALAG